MAVLACGHTNQGLVAIECGVPCDHESICCDGYMSKSKIVAKRPKMGLVLEHRMRWLVLKAIVIIYFNDIPRIVQAARQAIGQVQKVEGIFELLEAIQSLISGSGQATDWDMIIATVGQSESPFKEDLGDLCEFARIYGGGCRGQFLKRLLRFVRICVPDDQYIGIATIQAITAIKVKGDQHCPNVMAAILEAQAKCSQTFVKSEVCKYITDSEISTLANRTDDLVEAESILVQV